MASPATGFEAVEYIEYFNQNKVHPDAALFNINGVEWRWPHLVVHDVRLEGELITLHVELRDRDTGVLTMQVFTWGFDKMYHAGVPDPVRTKNLIRDAYLALVCHELDELLRIPEEWNDPHEKT